MTSLLIIVFAIAILFFIGYPFIYFVYPKSDYSFYLPTSIIFALVLYLFIINTIAHFYPSEFGVYISTLILLLSSLIVNSKTKYQFAPDKQKSKYFIYLSILFTLFFALVRTSNSNGADSIVHYSIGSTFIQGNFPLKSPWQPSYDLYYHSGTALIFAAIKTVTKLNFDYINPLISLISLMTISMFSFQLCTQLKLKNKYLISILLTFVSTISLGFIVIPFSLKLIYSPPPSLSWFLQPYGTPTSIDTYILFVHRLLGLSITFTLIISTIELLINKDKTKLKHILLLIITLSSLALIDETYFITATFSLFSLFLITKPNITTIKNITVISIVLMFLSYYQGGIIKTFISTHFSSNSPTLFFPKDGSTKFENYRTFRINQISPSIKSYSNNATLLFPGPTIELLILFFILIKSFLVKNNQNLFKIIYIIFSISLMSFFLYFAIVPKGILHSNGNRFIAMSYYFSSFGIIIYILCSKPVSILSNIIKTISLVVIIFSVLMSFNALIPRQKIDNLSIKSPIKSPTFEFIKKSLPANTKIIALIDNYPSTSETINLSTETGKLTPIWLSDYRVYTAFDTSPTFYDIFYTLTPELLQELEISHLLVNQNYININLLQHSCFTKIYDSPNHLESIYKINNCYFFQAINENTFHHLKTLIQNTDKIQIDYPPYITEHEYRILRLIFANKYLFYNEAGSFYNSQIDVQVNFSGNICGTDCDIYIIGTTNNINNFCPKCKVKKIWEHESGTIEAYRVIQK